MNDVYVGFSTTDGLISRAVRFLTGSRVSHCFLVYEDPTWERQMIIDADIYGLRLVPYDRYEKKNKVKTLVKIENEVPDPYLQLYSIGDHLGTRYDYGGLVGFLFVLLGRWLGKKIKNPLQSPSKLFCSEMVVKYLQKLRDPRVKDLNPANVSPRDLLKLLEPKV